MSVIVIRGGDIEVLPAGTKALEVHDPDQCAGRTCIVHAPTDHGMRHLPLIWRRDRGIFERLCAHGVGHPDPDQQAYWREQADRLNREAVELVVSPEDLRDPAEEAAAQMVHGCCGEGFCA